MTSVVFGVVGLVIFSWGLCCALWLSETEFGWVGTDFAVFQLLLVEGTVVLGGTVVVGHVCFGVCGQFKRV